MNCPYGKPGDRLWVREAWRVGAWGEFEGLFGQIAVDYKADNYPRREWLRVEDQELFERLWIQSSDDAMAAGNKPNKEGNHKWKPGQSPCRWRPSIFMPKWASRITLEIISVRVEKLQDICEEDTQAEGLADAYPIHGQIIFSAYWDHLHGKGEWNKNPWVWVIEFKRILAEKSK